MELLEIVVQGLQNARDLVRAPFAPGVTVMPAGPRERLYIRLVLDLLYPKGTEPTLTDVDDPGVQSRIGVTVQGRDNHRYRLLLDVKSGRRALQKLAAAPEAKPDVISSSSNEIAQAVTATIGFPQEDVLRELMFATREDLPSRRAKSASASASSSSSGGTGEVTKPKAEKPLPPGFEQTNPGVAGAGKPLPPGFSDFGAPVGGVGGSAARGGRSDEQIRARIAELDEILRTQGNVKELEFEMDGLQKKLFDIDARMKPLLTMRRSVQQAEEHLRRYASLDAVPSDIIEKGARLDKLRAEHTRDMRRLDDERTQLFDSAGTLDRRGRQQPLEVAQKDPFVLYGVGVGVVALSLAVVGGLADMPHLRWLAFLDIPAFGVALFGGLRVLASLERGEAVRRRIERLDVERKRLDDRFKIDEEQVLGILAKHGLKLEQLPDLEQQIKVRDEARAVLATTKNALADAEASGDTAMLQHEQSEAQARLKTLEEKVTHASAGFSSTADIQYEKEELESLLAGGITQRASATSAPLAELSGEDVVIHTAERAAYGGTAATVPTSVERGAEDLGKRLLQLAADVLMAPVEDVGAQVKGRATQILGALSDGRLKDVQLGGRGETVVVDAADDAIPFGQLPAFDRDLAWLAIKIALIETVVKRGRLPVIFDRSLDFLADAKGPMLQKMLTFLAAQTQVISISEKPALGGRPA